MNIFENANGFLGEIHPESLKNALAEFYETVAEMKGRLGHRSGLLDEYIKLVFRVIYEVNTETSSTDGFSSAMPELRKLCGAIVRDESEYEDHPLYKQAKHFIELHPFPHIKGLYRIDVYAGALVGDYGKYAIEKYYKKYDGRLTDSGYIAALKPLYKNICDILGAENVMEQFNMLIKRHFIIAPAMHSFLQGLMDDMLDTLAFQVPETAKLVFELVPDIEEENKRGAILKKKDIVRCDTCEYNQQYFKKNKNGFFVAVLRGQCQLTEKEHLSHQPACEKHKTKGCDRDDKK